MRQFIILSLLLPTMAFGQTAAEIVQKSEDKLRGESSYAEMKITTIRPAWTREMTIKSWSKGDELAMILITSPIREKGTAFLKKGKEVWNWVPRIERSVKLPPSMMSQSWMGTDLTNDDLVRETERDDDFTHKLLGEETIDGRKCWKIEMTPRENAAIIWGKIISWIDQEEYITMQSKFFDEDGELVNTLKASNIKTLGGKTLPSKLEMIPADKDGHKTIMVYQDLKFNIDVEDNFFSLQNMRNLK